MVNREYADSRQKDPASRGISVHWFEEFLDSRAYTCLLYACSEQAYGHIPCLFPDASEMVILHPAVERTAT
jgi:hypothetical protein